MEKVEYHFGHECEFWCKLLNLGKHALFRTELIGAWVIINIHFINQFSNHNPILNFIIRN